MKTPLCVQAHDFIKSSIRSGDFTLPSSSLVEHIATCDLCRGALMLLFAELLPIPPEARYTDCAPCQRDLAAYVDQEATAGIATAVQLYPHVWWHLWICPVCAEMYRLMRVLAEATQEGTLMPLPIMYPVSRPQLIHTFTLSRRLLNRVLPVQSSPRGVMRGSNAHRMLLAEEAFAGYQINLSVQRQPDDNWCVLVTVIPPAVGWLMVTLGEVILRARIDGRSGSILADVPSALLTTIDGPDLIVGVELETEDTNDEPIDGATETL